MFIKKFAIEKQSQEWLQRMDMFQKKIVQMKSEFDTIFREGLVSEENKKAAVMKSRVIAVDIKDLLGLVEEWITLLRR